MKKRILGLDTGTNSLGWAVVDRDEAKDKNQYELVRQGCLIFQEGVKIEKGIESSKSSERSGHRALRRQYFRRRLRKIEVLKVLVKYQLCPPLSVEMLQEWHLHKKYPMTEAFLEWQRTNENEDKNPYSCRYQCLTQSLNLDLQDHRYVLGRALYHLAQRRGFLSNRLDASDESDETGKVKGGISDLTKEIDAADCTYLGEYFYKLYKEQGNKVRLRTHYTSREEHYKKEFYAICNKQNLPEEMRRELERALYFQRPLKSQRGGVGMCTLEKHRARCSVSHPDYEAFTMWSFINNIKMKGPDDDQLRSLKEKEIEKILPKFYRVSSPNFDFEDIAKELAGKGKYQYINDKCDKQYKFNFRMSQGVPGCPTTAQFKNLFGDDWQEELYKSYTLKLHRDGSTKSLSEVIDDVWNACSSIETKEKTIEFAKSRLQLDDEKAEKFSKIKLAHSYGSLSLCAVRKILPYLKQGYKYSHAVFLANVPAVVGKYEWEHYRESILEDLNYVFRQYEKSSEEQSGSERNKLRLEDNIKGVLENNYNLKPGAIDRLYHPSMIETYPDAKKNAEGVLQLGSPRTNAIRNPMAMRSLHEIRKVVNQLLREGVIDANTEVHVEYARELNDANKRKALADWNRDRQKLRDAYRAKIGTLYKEQTGKDIEPTEDDILKYELWEEQEHKCLYTGAEIGVADFLGENPKFDIEHTVPRSMGGDSTRMNLTLCDSHFNRDIKKAQLPYQLANYEDILSRIAPFVKLIEEKQKTLDKNCRTHGGMEKSVKDRIIQKRHKLKIELDYLKGKVERFNMKEVPQGFALRQEPGIGLISKYAGLYLRSLFQTTTGDGVRSNVRVVKGVVTSEFRKMWGIQEEYAKKCRDNHVHHCVDAITIACIDTGAAQLVNEYYKNREIYEWQKGGKPSFNKPWDTFTEDVLSLYNSVIVAHDTPDYMPKKAKQKDVATPTGHHMAQGDSARASLHQDTYYGAIERDGEIRYVVRKALSALEKESDIEKIVDEAVRQKVKDAIAQNGGIKFLKNGAVYMNEEKGIKINKVRIYADAVKNPLNIRIQRDASRKEYKQQFHVVNDGNYAIAIYRGVNEKGKEKSDFELKNTLETVSCYSRSKQSVQKESLFLPFKNELPLKCVLKIGTRVIFYAEHPDEINWNNVADVNKRLYKVIGLSTLTIQKKWQYGNITFRHCQEARIATELKAKNGEYQKNEEYRPIIALLHSQFKALVEGYDFEMNALGEIKLLE